MGALTQGKWPNELDVRRRTSELELAYSTVHNYFSDRTLREKQKLYFSRQTYLLISIL